MLKNIDKLGFGLGASVLLAFFAGCKRDTPKDAADTADKNEVKAVVQSGQAEVRAKVESHLEFLPEIVAKSKDFEINAKDVRELAAPQIQQLMDAGIDLTDQQVKRTVADITNFLVDRQLLLNKCKEEGCVPSEEEVMEQIGQLRQQYGEEQFQNALASQNMKLEDLKKRISEQMAIEECVETKIAAQINIPEASAKEYYEANNDMFALPEMKQASHILISVAPDASEDTKTGARKEAEAILSSLKGGKIGFEDAAKKQSSCPSKQQGGDLGFFSREQMVPAFADVAFALDEGELSGVVETRFGFHIIKGGETQTGKTIPFEEMKDRILEKLKQAEVGDALQAYVQKMREDAQVQVMIEMPPADDALDAEPPAAELQEKSDAAAE